MLDGIALGYGRGSVMKSKVSLFTVTLILILSGTRSGFGADQQIDAAPNRRNLAAQLACRKTGFIRQNQNYGWIFRLIYSSIEMVFLSSREVEYSVMRNFVVLASIVLIAACQQHTSQSSSSPPRVASDSFHAKPVIAVKCHFRGEVTGIYSNTHYRVYQHPENQKFYVYRKLHFKKDGRWTIGNPKYFEPASVNGDVVRFWSGTSERYQGMKKIQTRRGADINTKTGVVTSIREVNGEFKSGSGNQCDFDPKGMEPLWLRM